MSQIKRLFEGHLNYLRKLAQQNDLQFVHLLSTSIKAPRNAIAERMQTAEMLEKYLVELYRLEFYEWAANHAMQFAEGGFQSLKARKRGEEESKNVRKAKAEKLKNEILAKATVLLQTKEKKDVAGIIRQQTGLSKGTIHTALQSHPSRLWEKSSTS